MTPSSPDATWVNELVQFLRSQPGVSAVRVDPDARKISMATIGPVDHAALEAKLAATIAAVEARLAARAPSPAPAGYLLRQDGAATVIGRDTCVTAEKLWLWREREAVAANRPPFFVLSHDLLVGIAEAASLQRPVDPLVPRHLSDRRRAGLRRHPRCRPALRGQRPRRGGSRGRHGFFRRS